MLNAGVGVRGRSSSPRWIAEPALKQGPANPKFVWARSHVVPPLDRSRPRFGRTSKDGVTIDDGYFALA